MRPMRFGVVDAAEPVGDAGRVVDRAADGRAQGDLGDAQERRLARSWLLVVVAFTVLAVLAVGGLVVSSPWLAALIVLAVLVEGLAGLYHRRVLAELEQARRQETDSFQRILQGLSRSVSPDAIVHAIVEDLGVAAAADHTVVVRLRADARILEATLVSSRAGVPSSTTVLPVTDLDDRGAGPTAAGEPAAFPSLVDAGAAERGFAPAEGPAGAPIGGRSTREQRIAEQLAWRVRTVYGLRNTLATALVADGRVVGAIVLSRRGTDPWPVASERMLVSAAEEASAALARAYSYRQAEARASTDPLTGLPNRRYFDEFCGLLARRRRAEDAVGVLMIDIDNFKKLNDRYGHSVGDQVLRAVADAIARAVREGDVPARFGGEEFAVLLRNPGAGIAVEVGERVRTAVGSLDLTAFGPRTVTVSVGVAVARTPDQPIADLVDEADRALYRAKRLGRDRVVAAAA